MTSIVNVDVVEDEDTSSSEELKEIVCRKVGEIRAQCKLHGRDRIVVGTTGTLDGVVAAALSSLAIGAENVLLVFVEMQSRVTVDYRSYVEAAAEQLGCFYCPISTARERLLVAPRRTVQIGFEESPNDNLVFPNTYEFSINASQQIEQKMKSITEEMLTSMAALYWQATIPTATIPTSSPGVERLLNASVNSDWLDLNDHELKAISKLLGLPEGWVSVRNMNPDGNIPTLLPIR